MEIPFFILSFLISGALLNESPYGCVCHQMIVAHTRLEICKNIRTRILMEGDRFEPRQCFFCECRNQTLNCKDKEPAACPEPTCDSAVQVSSPDRCCKICPGVGARCRFNGMSVEDGESFKLDPRGSCVCYDGKLTCSDNRAN